MKKGKIIWIVVIIIVIALLIWGYKTNWWGLKKSTTVTAAVVAAATRKLGPLVPLATLQSAGYTNIESNVCTGLGGTIVTLNGLKYCSQPNLKCPAECLQINDPK